MKPTIQSDAEGVNKNVCRHIQELAERYDRNVLLPGRALVVAARELSCRDCGQCIECRGAAPTRGRMGRLTRRWICAPCLRERCRRAAIARHGTPSGKAKLARMLRRDTTKTIREIAVATGLPKSTVGRMVKSVPCDVPRKSHGTRRRVA